MDIEYYKLDYEHKLLYVREVFVTAQESHSVYAKLVTLLSGQWKIQEKHLDMLYEQINSVVNDLNNKDILERMGALAAQLDRIQRMEQQDRAREAEELIEMEKMIMAIDDDKPEKFT